MTTSVAATSQNTSDLCRITKAKQAVDMSPNTVRMLFGRGLTEYKVGRAVYFSRSELELFVKRKVVLEGRTPRPEEKATAATAQAKRGGKAARK